MKFDDLKNQYKAASLLMRLIYINIAVFVVLRLVGIVSFLTTGTNDVLLQWVELPSNLWLLIRRPWTIITYMFSHYGVFHILFNMLWLYWLGRIFLEFFTPRQLGGLYVLGGLAGAALFVVLYNVLPVFASRHAFLIGASASVMAIVIAVAVYRPDYQIGLLFIGGISLKWVAIVTVFLDLLGIEGANMGGHIAHIGGMLMGLWFGLEIKRGHDITTWINRCIDAVVSLFQKRPSKKEKAWQPIRGEASGSQKSETRSQQGSGGKAKSVDDEARLDEILGKLKRSGYGALSDEEKEFLFNASRKR
jgi:membrane associated rhomboid family serine protease